MSENVRYYGTFTKYKKEDVEEIKKLSKDFQDAEVDVEDKRIVFSVHDGWRGGGDECETILKEHFGKFLKKHPKIELQVYCTYVELAPCEEINIKGDKSKSTWLE